MASFLKTNSIKKQLFTKSLLGSSVIFCVGLVLLAPLLYISITNYSRDLNGALAQQTSAAILPDLQDRNYYAIKRHLDQLVESSIFKEIIVVQRNNEVFAQSGRRDSRGIVTALSEHSQLKVHEFYKVGYDADHVIVTGIFDQNGFLWGKVVAFISEGRIIGLIRSVIVVTGIVLLLILGINSLLAYFIAKNTTEPLELLAHDIDALSAKLAEGANEASMKLRDLAADGMTIENGKDLYVELQLLRKAIGRFIERIQRDRKVLAQKQAAASIGEAAASIAHDIRSPLSVLKTYIAASNVFSVKDDDYELLRIAAGRSLAKLNNMASDLLDYSKAMKVTREICSVRDLIREAVEEASVEASLKEIDLIGECESLLVSVDRYKADRVIVNMVVNAIQASVRGQKIVVSVARDVNNGFVVTVRDSGCGIEKTNLVKIFESSFTFGKPNGTGLGLAYCKQVVEAHGGWIEVESELDKGTVFSLHFPSCVISEIQDGPAAVDDTRQQNVSKKRVMIVDDSADVRLQWKHYVQQNGGSLVYEYDSPENLQEKGFEVENVDLAIVDYHYERSTKTGIDVILYLKERGVNQVHLCTGFYSDKAIRVQAKDVGVDSIIPKPFDLSIIRKVLG